MRHPAYTLILLLTFQFQSMYGQELTRFLPDTLALVFSKAKPHIQTRTIQVGNIRLIHATVPIPAEIAHPSCRYGLVPFLTKSDGTLHSVLSPEIIDGEAYHRTQIRYMGFDLARDSLNDFVDTTQHIRHPHDADAAFHLEAKVKVNPSERCITQAYRWVESYTEKIAADSILLSDGYATQPMRWIDPQFSLIDIDASRYARPPIVQSRRSTQAVNLVFQAGKALIADTDTTGLAQLHQVISTLNDLNQDPSVQLMSIHVHGTASPEGPFAANELLGRQRSRYIAQYISDRLGLPVTDATSQVMSWKQVADSIAADSAMSAENRQTAEFMYRICQSVTSSQQEAHIRRLSTWPKIQSTYLPRCRQVYIHYQYLANRPLTADEVCFQWEHNTLTDLQPYMYAYLFRYLANDHNRLEQLALQAYNDKACMGADGQPWALAAWHLARCRFLRGITDTLVLKPYIQADAAMASLHVQMLAKAQAILDAYYVADSHLPDDTRFNPLKTLLDCMAYGWNKPDIREAIAATSAWNKVIVYAAQDAEGQANRQYWQKALNTLTDRRIFPHPNARELYMEAVLRNRLEGDMFSTRQDGRPYPSYIFSEEFGRPMVQCIEQHPAFMDTLMNDGEFNVMYRKGFAKYWEETHPASEQALLHKDQIADTISLAATRHILQPRFVDRHLRNWGISIGYCHGWLPVNSLFPQTTHTDGLELRLSYASRQRLGIWGSGLLSLGKNGLQYGEVGVFYAPLRTVPVAICVGIACGQVMRGSDLGDLKTFFYAPAVALRWNIRLSSHVAAFLAPSWHRIRYNIPYANRTNERLHLTDNVLTVGTGLQYLF